MSQTIQLNLTSIPELVDTSSLNNGWFYHKEQMLLKISSGALIRLRVAYGTEAIFEPFQYQLPKRPLDSDLLTVNTLEATDTVPTTFVNKNYQIAVYNGNEIMLRVGNSFYSLKTGDFVEEYVNTTVYTRVTAFNLSLNYNECSGGSEGGENIVTVLSLQVTEGATESVDGEYQRFELTDSNDSSWIVQLAEVDWKTGLEVQFKMPLITSSDQSLTMDFSDAVYPEGYTAGIGVRLMLNADNLYFGATTTFYNSVFPPADTIVTLTIANDSISIAYDAVSETIDISVHELAPLFNCAVNAVGFEGTVAPSLSIKVTELV